MRALHTSILIAAAIMVSVGCNFSSDSSAIVAKIGEKTLTWEELKGVIPNESSPKDSAMLAERYIQEWFKEQVVLNQAEANLEDEQKNFDEMIDNYRKSLLMYAYEQQLVRQKLDTTVKSDEIERYYNNNLQNFQLKDYIVKLKFCAVGIDNKNIKTLKKLFNSSDPADLVKWEKLCVENNASYYFDEDKWMLWDEFIQQIPITVVDKEGFLKKNKSMEFEKDNNLYLIAITDYQLSGSQSPLSFETEKIRGMIINNRKMELLTNMREDLYNKALQSKEIETFYSKQ